MSIVFVHVPKTAGMALKEALTHMPATTRIQFKGYNFDSQAYPFSYRIIERSVRRLYTIPALSNLAEQLWTTSILNHTPPCIFGQINMKCYSVPTTDGWKPHPSFRYIAFMRNPLTRAISHYYYNCASARAFPQDRNLRAFVSEFPTLVDFLLSEKYADFQTRYMLYAEHFHFIGVTELMQQSIHVLRHIEPFFRALPDIQVINQGTDKNSHEIDSLLPTVTQRFQELHQKDYQRYTHAIQQLNHTYFAYS